MGVELEVADELIWSTRRVDRYIRPKQWFKPREEVEDWEMGDDSCSAEAATETLDTRLA